MPALTRVSAARRTTPVGFGDARRGVVGVLSESRRCRSEERRNVNLERRRELVDVVETDVPEAALNTADIGTVEVGDVRQAFLRETALLAEFSDALALGVAMVENWHPSTLAGRRR